MSLPGRRGWANTTDGWVDVEVEINNMWVKLSVLREKFCKGQANHVDMSTNELRLLSF
jgi:hypothetical protein